MRCDLMKLKHKIDQQIGKLENNPEMHEILYTTRNQPFPRLEIANAKLTVFQKNSLTKIICCRFHKIIFFLKKAIWYLYSFTEQSSSLHFLSITTCTCISFS